MKAQRTGTKAAEELRALYGRNKDGERGRRLTMEVIRQAVGVSTVQTVFGWLAEPGSEAYHEPKGASLSGLNRFLDEAKNQRNLKALMARGGK